MLTYCIITRRIALSMYNYAVTEDLPDLERLLASWLRELRGQRKSPHTIGSYGAGIRSFLQFCDTEDVPRAVD